MRLDGSNLTLDRPAPGKANTIACILSDCDGVIVDSEVIAKAIMVELMTQTFGAGDLAAHRADMFERGVID